MDNLPFSLGDAAWYNFSVNGWTSGGDVLLQVACRTMSVSPFQVFLPPAILIVEAIIKGNRNAQHLITLFKNTGKSIAGTEQRMQSLQGKWNDQYIFVMKQQLEQYRFCEKQISELDAQRDINVP